MKIKLIEHKNDATERNIVYLIYSHWDDYGYCTTFNSYFRSTHSEILEELGVVKIGCDSLVKKVKPSITPNGYNSYSMKELIPTTLFDNRENSFFSLGQELSYYENINKILGEDSFEYYQVLNDLAYNFDLFKELYDSSNTCLRNSLMRTLYYSNVEQFNRVSKGDPELTKYSFVFKYDDNQIDIQVNPKSLPPSNIHVLIGRNGVGKTWLLHNIVIRLLENSDIGLNVQSSEKYSVSDRFTIDCPMNSFAGVIGLSFSVFDDALFLDIAKDDNISDEMLQKQKIDDFNKKYKYIGLISKSQKDGKKKTKSVDDLALEFMDALNRIKKSKSKTRLYLETCNNLNTDSMFYDNGFIELLSRYLNKNGESRYIDYNNKKYQNEVEKKFKQLSSGHMIIILSLTLLSESIYEKTIVLIDEPETHLHPPLLSTYIRTLSFLLIKKNAVAIIATHSPIVLQEVPKDCVSRIERTKYEMTFHDIKIESFATSTDSLTREVFGLEVVKTGFYQLIEKEIGSTFDESFRKFEQKVGFLGQVLMQSLVKKKGDINEENK